MNGSHFMVMAATGKGWLQVSPMMTTQEAANTYKLSTLATQRMPSIGREGCKVNGTDISGKMLRVFEVR